MALWLPVQRQVQIACTGHLPRRAAGTGQGAPTRGERQKSAEGGVNETGGRPATNSDGLGETRPGVCPY